MNEVQAGSDPALARFLEAMASPDKEVRQTTAAFARRRGAAVLPGLAHLSVHADPAVAKNARMAMESVAHYAAQPGAESERNRVADALLLIARDNAHSRMARAHALRLLGFVGGAAHAKALAVLATDRELGEDVRMASERIRRAV